jgi:ribosomal RNA assembly protein
MSTQIYSENTRKILQNRKILEKELKVKINLEIKNKIIIIEGKAEDELIALEAIEAINLGFPISKVILLKNEEFTFRKLQIKAITKRHNLSQVRARVIGAKRKALDTIESLTDTFIALHNNDVGIIGKISDVQKAEYVLVRIIAGSKHANMYAWLEKKKAEEKRSF